MNKGKKYSHEKVEKSSPVIAMLVFGAVLIIALNAIVFLPHKTVSYTVQVPYQAQESYYAQVPYQVQEPYTEEVSYQEKENVKTDDLKYEIVGDRNPNPYWKSGGFLWTDGYWKVILQVKNTDSKEGCITVNGKILEGTKNKELRTEANERKCLIPGEIGSFDFTYNGYHSDDVDFEYTIDSGVYEEKDVTKSREEQRMKTVTKYKDELRYRTVTKNKPETRYKKVNWVFTDRCFIC